MSLMRFVAGLEVLIEKRVHRFIEDATVDGRRAWILKRLGDGHVEAFPVSRLRRLFDEGDLKKHHTEADGTAAQREAARRKRVHVLDDLPKKDADRRKVRGEFIRRVRARVGAGGMHAKAGTDANGKPVTLLERALADVSVEMREHLKTKQRPERVVSQSTYYKWLALAPDPEDPRGLEGDFSSRGRRHQLHPVVVEATNAVMLGLITNAQDKRSAGKPATITMGAVKDDIENRLKLERLNAPGLAEELRVPSDPTLYRYWNRFPAYDRMVAKMGPSRARREFRFIRGHEAPEAPFETVEYDETAMPFFFYDEIHRVPLGKAHLCPVLDVATRAVGGFYVGFEPFSDLTMMCALRHAASLKSYVSAEYGDRITNDYLPGGMFRCVALDNSRQAWGGTLKAVAGALDCDRVWLPPRTPWFKPIVEGFFKLLNTLLLRELPGFDLGKGVDRVDYDPARNACIGLRHFLLIFHKWLLDVYHVRSQEGLGDRSPDERWRELLKNGEPGLLDSRDDLDSLFGVVREGTLDHRGVQFETIRYRSDDLANLILAHGVKKRVRFKINPTDLLHAMVWHPRAQGWVPAKAADENYAQGLSLRVHQLVRQHTRRKGRVENASAHLLGLSELRELIADSLPQARSIGANAAIARAMGLGTQNLLGRIDHQGRLGPASGPWEGQRLNPWAEPAPKTLPAPPPAGAPAGGPRDADCPAPAAGGGAGRPSPAPSRAVRPRKIFEADDSLSSPTRK